MPATTGEPQRKERFSQRKERLSWNQGAYVKFTSVNCKFFYLKIEGKKLLHGLRLFMAKGTLCSIEGEKNHRTQEDGSTEPCVVRDPSAFRSNTANRV